MSERLYRNVIPRHYTLDFQPNLDSLRVRVKEGIDLDVLRTVRSIELHGVELEVSRVTVSCGGRTLEGSAKAGKGGQTIVFRFPEPLPVGKARLDLLFHAKIRTSLSGLYLARRGEDRFLATQFEATDARAAFVCLDEPDAKATFSISATVPDDWIAISNAPERAASKFAGGRARHSFARTRLLPTYLVALCAGPWEASEVRTVRGIPVRVLAPRGRGKLARTALDFACAAQAALEDYFGLPYPFAKCDHLAVPDFAAGAMENAGCITYRETLLLVDPATISITQLRDMANVITHELSHQWFGNLVTPVWWSDLWLNESFATWVTERVLDGLHPEWEVWTAAEQSKGEAFSLDALASTHPVRTDSQKVQEIQQSFDAITYQKGAAVLRMIESYLGEAVMQAGIRAYLRRHADANATGEDLWQALEEASGKPVSRILSGWISQPGFPLVKVDRRDGKVALGQERFFADPAKSGAAARKQRWQIPIVLSGPSVEERLVLEGRASGLAIPPETAWITANGGSGGFYRTEYDRKSRKALVDRFGGLDAAERAGLLGDLWALARAGRAGLDEMLAIVDGLGSERNYVVLGRGLGCLRALGDGIVPESSRTRFSRRIARIFEPHFEELGWNRARGEPEADRLRRAGALDALGDLAREPSVRARAAETAERYLASVKGSDPDLLPIVLRIAARTGDERLFERIDEKRRRAPTPQLERTFLLARCDFEDPALIDRVLAETLAESVRSQDIAMVIARLFWNPKARTRTWAFVREHFDEINKRAIWFMWKRIVDSLLVLGTPKAYREIRVFFQHHPLPDAADSVRQTLEAMRVDLTFRRRARPRVVRWLAAQDRED